LQLLWEMTMFNEDFGSSMPSLPLTLPPAQRAYGPEGTLNPEPVNGYVKPELWLGLWVEKATLNL